MSTDCKFNYPQIARDSGFKLSQSKYGVLDLRLIGTLDVDSIIREQQFEKIDDLLSFLSEAPLAPVLETNILDSSMGKYFSISQLAVQYLLFCRKFLDESVNSLRESLFKTKMENQSLKTSSQERSQELVQLHKKINHLETLNNIIFPCHVCSKNFVSNDALNIHLNKKHSNALNNVQCSSNDKTLINTIKLELEVKHLKERLNIAEKYIRETSRNNTLSARQCSTISVSTQINTINVDIATQCNLLETKEMDSSTIEKSMELSYSELQKKILDLEYWKEVHCSEEKYFMIDVLQNLQQIKDDLCLKHDQDTHKLNAIFEESTLTLKCTEEIITTSTKNLQTFILNSISDVIQRNSEKLLDTILNKNEIINSKTRLYSQIVVPVDRTKTQNNADQILIDDITAAESPTNQIYKLEESLSIEKLFSESSLDVCAPVSDPTADLITNTIFKTTSKNVGYNMLSQKMTLYGVPINTKDISIFQAEQVFSHILDKRSDLQQMNPEFITTRNKLESFINGLNIKKIDYKRVRQQSLNAFKLKFIKQCTLKNVSKESKSFKERLENILCSSINKPLLHDLNYTTDSSKPVPLPRKKVMFHPAKVD